MSQLNFTISQADITLTTSYQLVYFGFTSEYMWIHVNDTNPANKLEISLDGINLFDQLQGSPVASSGYSLDFRSDKDYPGLHTNGIYIKAAGTPPSSWELAAYPH
jgi:hypothetical protein